MTRRGRAQKRAPPRSAAIGSSILTGGPKAEKTEPDLGRGPNISFLETSALMSLKCIYIYVYTYIGYIVKIHGLDFLMMIELIEDTVRRSDQKHSFQAGRFFQVSKFLQENCRKFQSVQFRPVSWCQDVSIPICPVSSSFLVSRCVKLPSSRVHCSTG